MVVCEDKYCGVGKGLKKVICGKVNFNNCDFLYVVILYCIVISILNIIKDIKCFCF